MFIYKWDHDVSFPRHVCSDIIHKAGSEFQGRWTCPWRSGSSDRSRISVFKEFVFALCILGHLNIRPDSNDDTNCLYLEGPDRGEGTTGPGLQASPHLITHCLPRWMAWSGPEHCHPCVWQGHMSTPRTPLAGTEGCLPVPMTWQRRVTMGRASPIETPSMSAPWQTPLLCSDPGSGDTHPLRQQ